MADVEEKRRTGAKKATGAAVFGTFIEYYDFSVYGYVAATLAVVFFPSDDPVSGLLNTFLVFGSAFLVRPVGAWFFGRLGDRKGRRVSLIASISMMGAAATLTGLLPDYDAIGVAAPILLVILRMMQGFSAGGEIGGAASYIREWAPTQRRPFYISFVPAFGNLGKGMAAGVAALIALAVPAEAMLAWGWRVPFLLALPLGILVLVARLKVADSPEFVALSEKKDTTKQPFGEVWRDYRPQLFKVIGISTVQNLGTYIGTVFVATYFSEVLGFSSSEASTIVLIAVLTAACLIPVAGLFGNRVGARKTLIIAYVLYVVVTFPTFMMMNTGVFGLAIAGLALGMIPYALSQAGTYSSVAEFYPTRVRHTGVAVGHSVGAVIGGGAGPYLATWLIATTGNTYMPAFVLMLAGAFGLVLVTFAVRRNSNPADHLFR
ncbi:MAG: MFS transporter [Rhodococcus sp. (in: high G+C Gram-positive bacteria)]